MKGLTIRQSSSTGPCKYVHNYDKKIMLNFCKRKKGKKSTKYLANMASCLC